MVWNIPAIPEMIGHKFEDIFAVVNEGDHLYFLASSEWWSQKENKYTAGLQKTNDTHFLYSLQNQNTCIASVKRGPLSFGVRHPVS